MFSKFRGATVLYHTKFKWKDTASFKCRAEASMLPAWKMKEKFLTKKKVNNGTVNTLKKFKTDNKESKGKNQVIHFLELPESMVLLLQSAEQDH